MLQNIIPDRPIKIILFWFLHNLVGCSLQRAVAMIPAHDNPLASLAFNAQGTKLATASEKVRQREWTRMFGKTVESGVLFVFIEQNDVYSCKTEVCIQS